MKEIVEPLLTWFKENKRDLEWRKNPTCYSIWISEVMLQQTKAEAVRPYYIRFMEELPDYVALANCKEEKLMKLWEGLGYYSRARNLQKCAKEIMEKYNGKFPTSYEEAIKLPGIGAYTCGAILSRTFNQKIAAVDGNVLRVLSRYLCSKEDISKEQTKHIFKKEIEKILPMESGAFNEALMELGAMICTPKVIRCEQCPLKKTCKAYNTNTQNQYPIKKKPMEKKILEYTLLFITNGKEYVFLPKKDGVLKGLPSPVLVSKFLTANDALAYTSSLGLEPLREIPLRDRKHVFTHQIWHMKAYIIQVKNLLSAPKYSKEQIQNELAIPTCFKQFLEDLID